MKPGAAGLRAVFCAIALACAPGMLSWAPAVRADDARAAPARGASAAPAAEAAPAGAKAQRAASAHKAAIASAYPLASQAGQEIFAAGGNAFDAAVAVSAALAVVEPSSSGLGGGGFYLLHRQSDGYEAMVDAREKAPGAASRDMYLDKAGNAIEDASISGALSAAIPGEPAAFEHLAVKYGRLPLARSLQPAIRLAREGFPLYARLQGGIRYKRAVLARSPDAARAFLTPEGDAPALGTIIKQPELANTLEAIAKQGAKGFYTGRVAADLVAGVKADGGIWTSKDLADYRVVERKPLYGEYHGARIVSASPPSSGGIALIDALNILSGYDLKRWDSAVDKHLVIEAMRRAYRDRAIYLGDPDFIKMPLRQLSSLDYAAGQRTSIRVDKAMPSSMLPGIESEPVGMQTTHFSVLDAEGNRVAATISVNLFFGNGYVPPHTGVLLNNTMDDFSTKPGHPNEFGLIGATANSIQANKRSLSSMTPTFVETPKGLMIIGSPGGSFIISMVLLGTLNYLDGMSAADIVKYPHYHHQYLPDVVDYEQGAFTDEEIKKLEAMGHPLKASSRQWGNMQVITWDFASGKVEAASDPRGEGVGLVY
ncbi:MAG TPA: gamma-glutamyltransferase [Steroidobacteraceae bacterium]|jgi:gamma-glutamyltranspeptidase/glutathione hydrolase|nr:gamma-glutamyltransferase [Steroidobacteraceae bacterium]